MTPVSASSTAAERDQSAATRPAGIDDAIPAADMAFARAFTEQMGDVAQTPGAFGPRLSVPVRRFNSFCM
jgi:hypothetical protein